MALAARVVVSSIKELREVCIQGLSMVDSWDFTFIWNVQNSELVIEIKIKSFIRHFTEQTIELKNCNAGMNELSAIHMACIYKHV